MSTTCFESVPHRQLFPTPLTPFRVAALAALLLAALTLRTPAAAPSVQPFPNVTGILFAVDEQTNIYVNAYGPIVKLNAAGAIVSSNSVSPYYGRAQRDAAGNFYFAD